MVLRNLPSLPWKFSIYLLLEKSARNETIFLFHTICFSFLTLFSTLYINLFLFVLSLHCHFSRSLLITTHSFFERFFYLFRRKKQQINNFTLTWYFQNIFIMMQNSNKFFVPKFFSNYTESFDMMILSPDHHS